MSKKLQPKTSNRTIAKVMGVASKTVDRDAASNDAGGEKKASIVKGGKAEPASFDAPLSGAAAAKAVESKENNYIPQYSRRDDGAKPIPRAQTIIDRKQLFEGVLKFVQKGGGWLVSPPGAKEVRMECLPGSTLPDELRKLGYVVEADGEGTRLIPHAITEAVITAGSTRPSYRTTHAGFATVDRFTFNLP